LTPETAEARPIPALDVADQPEPHASRRALSDRIWMALAGVVLLGAALRFATLDVRSYWIDEAATVDLAEMGFRDAMSLLAHPVESTPPLYFVLAWFWSQFAGVGEFGLRSLSALFGTATILVVYAIGAHLVSRRVGVVAALVAAVSPILVWHAQDARTYALVILLSGLSFLFFVQALEAPRASTLVLWAAVSGLLLTSHYFAVFLVVPEAAWLFLRHRSRSVTAAIGFVGAVGFAMFLFSRQTSDAPWIAGLSLPSRLVQVPAHFLVGYQPPLQIAISVVGGLLAAAAAWLLVTRADGDERSRIVPPLVIGAAAIGLPVLVAVGGYDRLITRAMTIAWIPLAVVLATGLASRRAGRAGIAVTAALCALFLTIDVATANDPKFEREDWRSAAEAIGPVASRAIVLPTDNGFAPMFVYRPHTQAMPAEGVRVSEVVLIATPPEYRKIGETPKTPRPATVAPPAPGFRQVERVEGGYFTLFRFRSSSPALVGPELAHSAIEGPGGVLVETP
jgi:hypothetical protein